MPEKNVTIVNKLGLHARAAAKLVAHASRYASELKIIKDGNTINGKSIMGVMMLAASKGTALMIAAEGDDAPALLDDIEALIADRFGEAD